MKRIWVRHASISATTAPPVTEAKITAARAALQSSPDERNKHRDFARLLSANGNMDELAQVLARWSSRDPMDGDVIAMRADLAARSGDRERALRVLSGVAASGQADVSTLEALAQSHERAGEMEGACSFRIAVAESRAIDTKGALTGVDLDRVAKAMACEERRSGRASRRWFDDVKDTSALDRAFQKAKVDSSREALRGDIIVEASWAGSDADLDLAVVDPNGQRLSWVTRSKNVRVLDPASKNRETLAVASSGAGAFTIEVTRAAGEGPVRANIKVRALGEETSFPVVLSGPTTVAGRVQMRFDEELVPVDGPGTGAFEVWGR